MWQGTGQESGAGAKSSCIPHVPLERRDLSRALFRTSETLANPVQRRLGQMGGRCCARKNFGKVFKINLTSVLKPESLTSIEIYFSMKA